jgi:hypothetical protein
MQQAAAFACEPVAVERSSSKLRGMKNRTDSQFFNKEMLVSPQQSLPSSPD